MSQDNFSNNPPYHTLKNEFRNLLQKSISDHKDIKLGAFNDKSEIVTLFGKINAWEQCLEIFNKFCHLIENPQPQLQTPQSNPSNPAVSPFGTPQPTASVSEATIVDGNA